MIARKKLTGNINSKKPGRRYNNSQPINSPLSAPVAASDKYRLNLEPDAITNTTKAIIAIAVKTSRER